MNFKKWPYWVRGGILFTLVGIIACKIFLFDNAPSSPPTGIADIAFTLLFAPVVVAATVAFSLGAGSTVFIPSLTLAGYFITILLSLAIYFVLGAILGWLYGKIKKKVKT